MDALRKPTLLTAALALMLALVLGALAMFGGKGAAAADSVTVKPGNFKCADIPQANLPLGVNKADLKELKVEPVADGTYSDGTLTVTIDVRNIPQGPVFDFTSNIVVTAVAVKGGPVTNFYTFDPPKTSATGLHAPVNPNNNKFYGLSHISFCYVPTGNVKIIKTDDADKPLAGAEFTLYKDNTVTTFKCTTGADGTCTINGVTPGNYWIVETITPTGYDTASPIAISVAGGQTVTKTFVDPRQRGAILVTKLRKHAAAGSGDHPHAGVQFTVNGVTKTTDANGKACFDNLLFGNFTVHEVTPARYKGEADKTVTVNNKASCSDNPYVGETVTFHNTPLSNITVSFESQESGGTVSKIDCTSLTATPPDTTPNAFNDTSETFKDLVPGTYNCTVVIDP